MILRARTEETKVTERTLVTVHGRPHYRRNPASRCRLSANAVTEVLEEMGVWVDERDINGWQVGNLRLQLASGIGGLGGYFLKEMRGPRVRSRVAYTREDIRELCRDFFPRRRRQAPLRFPGPGPDLRSVPIIRPRCLNERGEQVSDGGRAESKPRT